MKHLLFEGIENFRDVGGYETPYGETSYGVLFRSGNFLNATEHDLAKVRSLGIKTILDLRSAYDKQEHPSPFKNDSSIKVVEISVGGEGRIPDSREDQFRSYFEMTDAKELAKKAFETILYSEKPLLVHCNAGKDRTGVFLALTLLMNGVSLEDVNADYLMSFPLLPKLTAITKQNRNVSRVLYTPLVDYLPRFFGRFIKKYGGFEDYFRFLGFSKEDIQLLESLLGKQERSYGAVLLKDGKVLLEKMVQGHTSLVKGHIEPSDKDGIACAKREILEETGFVAEIDGSDQYAITYSPQYGVSKRVTFYRGRILKGQPVAQKEEVNEIVFLAPEEAFKALTFESDKAVLRWALEKKELL